MAECKSRDAIQEAKWRERDADKQIQKAQKKADKRIQTIKTKTKDLQKKAENREMIWAVGMIATMLLGMTRNTSLLVDIGEALLLPFTLYQLLESTLGWIAIVFALASAIIFGIIGMETWKVVRKKWNYLYMFYLVLSVAVTVTLGDMIKSMVGLNQVMVCIALFLITMMFSWRIGFYCKQ